MTPSILAEFEREHARIQLVIAWWKGCDRPVDLGARIHEAQAALALAIGGVLAQMGRADGAMDDSWNPECEVDRQQSIAARIAEIRDAMIERGARPAPTAAAPGDCCSRSRHARGSTPLRSPSAAPDLDLDPATRALEG